MVPNLFMDHFSQVCPSPKPGGKQQTNHPSQKKPTKTQNKHKYLHKQTNILLLHNTQSLLWSKLPEDNNKFQDYNTF